MSKAPCHGRVTFNLSQSRVYIKLGQSRVRQPPRVRTLRICATNRNPKSLDEFGSTKAMALRLLLRRVAGQVVLRQIGSIIRSGVIEQRARPASSPLCEDSARRIPKWDAVTVSPTTAILAQKEPTFLFSLPPDSRARSVRIHPSSSDQRPDPILADREPLLRLRSSLDSPLEGTGFEPSVPP